MKNTPDYHHVIESALLDIAQSSRTERVKALQADALSELKMRLNQYAGHCYDPALLCAIASKKSRWIMEAGTKNELNAILNPPAPRYDGNKFYAGVKHPCVRLSMKQVTSGTWKCSRRCFTNLLKIT